jgi:hypothetical protein
MPKNQTVPILEKGRVQINARWYRTSSESIREHFCTDPQDLARWEKRICPWIGRKLRSIKRLVREVGGGTRRKLCRVIRRKLYLESDLEQIRDARNTAEEHGRPRPDRTPWPSTKELAAEGINRQLLKRFHKRKKITSRPGTRVRLNGGIQAVTEWDPRGVSLLRERIQARPGNRKEGYITDREAAEPPYCIPPTTLGRWRDKKGNGCPYLNRHLDAYRDTSGSQEKWFNSVADLKEIVRLRNTPHDAPWTDPRDGKVIWPVCYIQQHYGTSDAALDYLRDRDRLNKKRRKGTRRSGGRKREAPDIEFRKIPIPCKSNRQWEVWGAVKDDFMRYMAWKNGRSHQGSGSSDLDTSSVVADAPVLPAPSAASNRSSENHALPVCAYGIDVMNPRERPIPVFVVDPPEDPREHPPVVLTGDWKDGATVLREHKTIETYTAWRLIKALLHAGPDGLDKDAIEAVASNARTILRTLRQDPDWAQVIEMAERRGGRYRIRVTQIVHENPQ